MIKKRDYWRLIQTKSLLIRDNYHHRKMLTKLTNKVCDRAYLAPYSRASCVQQACTNLKENTTHCLVRTFANLPVVLEMYQFNMIVTAL